VSHWNILIVFTIAVMLGLWIRKSAMSHGGENLETLNFIDFVFVVALDKAVFMTNMTQS